MKRRRPRRCSVVDVILADQKLDVIAGSAGALLVLLGLHAMTGNANMLENGLWCGENLLNRRVQTSTGHRAWATLDGKPLTGFSHGAAGIAMALAKLHAVTGDKRLLEAAQGAMSYERSVRNEMTGDWAELRRLPEKCGQPGNHERMVPRCNRHPGLAVGGFWGCRRPRNPVGYRIGQHACSSRWRNRPRSHLLRALGEGFDPEAGRRNPQAARHG